MCYRYFILLFLLWSYRLVGQDVHFSQYNYNYHNLSPALTGLFDGDHRITANYRNQWLSVPVPYMTFSIFYDTRIGFSRGRNFLNLGIGMDYDQAGDSRLNLAKLVGSLSYSRLLGKKHMLSVGLNPAIAQRRFNNEKLRWDVQWNGDRYDKTISSKEQFNNTGDFFLDLGAGIGYDFALTRRTRFHIQTAVFHINRPDQSFAGISSVKSRLPERYSFSSQLQLGLGAHFDLVLGAMYGRQQDYEEKLGMGMVRLYLNKTPGQVLNLLLGFNARLNDAMIPNIGVEFRNWLISGSYDINTSSFQTASRKRGGPEITAQYIFKSVKSPGLYKKCPIY